MGESHCRRLGAVIALALVILGSGCSRLAFMEEPLENFGAYYNTYYNAERALEEGIRAFEDRVDAQPIDQDVFLSMFGRSTQAATQRQPFEDAVSKSSDLLRKFPDSKWVDDAILIIGKAWFFTLNFVGAEQKFNEIFTLDSPLHDEARFWLARTLIASGAYDEAFNHLQASLSAENVSERWEPYYRLALAELHVQRENWAAAALELENGIEDIREDDIAARASFLAGQVYEKLERYEDAIAAYQSIQSYKPFYELSYAAQYSAIRVQVDHADPEVAMQWLRQMERDDKNFDHRSKLAYLRGRILIALGHYGEALDMYDELLYDPNVRANDVRGQVHYALGVFYRDVHSDYPFAAAHFDTAGQALQRNSGSSRRVGQQATAVVLQPSPGAITDSDEQARVFGSFSTVADRLAHFDSLMYLGSLDDSSFQAVVLELRRKQAELMEESERELLQRQAESSFGSSQAGPGFDGTGQGGGATSGGEAGFLFHRDPVRMEQARQDFVLLWGDRPLAPNWRRLAAIEALALDDEADALSEFGELGSDLNLPIVDISEVPRDEESWEIMREQRAMSRYELGNVLFLSMSMPDSAMAWYRMVIEDDWDLPVAQRALYALAEVQSILGDEAAARGIYEVIIRDYPESEFVHRAYERLGLEAPEGLITDSLGLAEQAFIEIEERWESAPYDTLIGDLVDLAVTWPNTEVAPRALFGATRTYMSWAARDSLDILGEIPVAVEDSLLELQGYFERPEGEETPKPERSPGDTTVAEPQLPPVNIELLLRQITRNYNESIQAEQADLVLAALDEIKAARQAVLDSLATVRADSIALANSMMHMAASYLVAPDTLVLTSDGSLIVGDSLLIRAADTLAMFNDLDRVAARSLIMGDSLDLVLADSLVARDSLAVFADSLVFGNWLTVATDSVLAITDSLLLAAAAELARLDSLNQAAGADSSGVADSLDLAVGADSLGVVDSQAAQETQRAEQQPDRPQMPAQPPGQAREAGEVNLEDPSIGNIDWTAGGYTIYIAAYLDRQMAVAFVENFQHSLSDIPEKLDIYGAAVESGVEFRVGLGLFETLQDAEVVMQRAGARLPGDAKVVFVRPKEATEEE